MTCLVVWLLLYECLFVDQFFGTFDDFSDVWIHYHDRWVHFIHDGLNHIYIIANQYRRFHCFVLFVNERIMHKR